VAATGEVVKRSYQWQRFNGVYKVSCLIGWRCAWSVSGGGVLRTVFNLWTFRHMNRVYENYMRFLASLEDNP
jgi:hypothetical protein